MSETKRTARQRAADFIGALRQCRHDRGKLAALRRGLSPATVMDAWPVVAGLGGDISHPVYVELAAMFALHPEESEAHNFGETCRRIALVDNDNVPDSFERRFRRLLACESVEDVLQQLRSWVRLAASKGVGINYESLFADLWHWPWYAEDVRVKWARGFWHSGQTEPTEQQSAVPATSTSSSV